MKILKQILKAVAIGAGAGVDVQAVEIDLQQLGVKSREFIVTGKTVTHAVTAPGAAKTFKVNIYFSDEKVALASVAAQLADRKVASNAKTLTNTANTTQYWEFAQFGVLRPKARYLYVTIDNDAVTAAFNLTLNAVRVPSTHPKE